MGKFRRIQGAGVGDSGKIGHPRWLSECGCALTPLFVPHLSFKLKNNVKPWNSASYKSPKYIYSFIVSTLDLLEPCLSDETAEIVSNLFVFPPFFPHFQETISVWDIMVLSV